MAPSVACGQMCILWFSSPTWLVVFREHRASFSRQGFFCHLSRSCDFTILLSVHNKVIYLTSHISKYSASMRFAVLTILLWTALVQAWLPADRDLFGNITHEALDSTLAAGRGRTVKRRLPVSGKIRGVNLGSMFVMEPWMAGAEWSNLDCRSY